jgi:hypothetical protein
MRQRPSRSLLTGVLGVVAMLAALLVVGRLTNPNPPARPAPPGTNALLRPAAATQPPAPRPTPRAKRVPTPRAGQLARGKRQLDPDRVALYHQHRCASHHQQGPPLCQEVGRALRVHDVRERALRRASWATPTPGRATHTADWRACCATCPTAMAPKGLGSSSQRVSLQALYMLIESVPSHPDGRRLAVTYSGDVDPAGQARSQAAAVVDTTTRRLLPVPGARISADLVLLLGWSAGGRWLLVAMPAVVDAQRQAAAWQLGVWRPGDRRLRVPRVQLPEGYTPLLAG